MTKINVSTLILVVLVAVVGIVIAPSSSVQAESLRCATLNGAVYSGKFVEVGSVYLEKGEVITQTVTASAAYALNPVIHNWPIEYLASGYALGNVASASFTVTTTGTYNIAFDTGIAFTGGIFDPTLTHSIACSGAGSGPAVPKGFVLRTITCDTAVFDTPGGSPVGSNRIKGGQTWYVNPTSKNDAQGSAWTEVFVSGTNNVYVPTRCVAE